MPHLRTQMAKDAVDGMQQQNNQRVYADKVA